MKLPKRQMQVLDLVATGATNDEIAEQLGVTVNTVKTHLKKTYKTLGAANAPHAVAIGYQHGLIGARR